MDIDRLTPRARAEHYRDCAQRQLRLAAGAETPELRATCLELAAMWTRLAEAVAHTPTMESEPLRQPRDPDREASA